MKKGINIWSFPAQTLKESFLLAKKAGFDGVEVALLEDGEINMQSTKEDMEIIKAAATDAGIELYSVATDLHWKYFLTSEDPQNREMAKAVIKKQLDVAEWLGCDTILVVPGAVGVDFIPGSEIVDYDVAYERAFEGICEVAKYAEEKKVFVALENVGNKMLLTPLEMRDFVDRIGSAHVGVYFDVGNIMPIGFPEQWIKILGKRIKKVHIKDYRKSTKTFVELLGGNVDFPVVMERLAEIGYDDWITAEIGPIYVHYPEMLLYTTSMSMDKIMKRI